MRYQGGTLIDSQHRAYYAKTRDKYLCSRHEAIDAGKELLSCPQARMRGRTHYTLRYRHNDTWNHGI
jgi:hypothetical protein